MAKDALCAQAGIGQEGGGEVSARIKPCPFCGGEDVRQMSGFIRCFDCLADGPFCVEENALALTRWNKVQAKSEARPEPSRLEIAAMLMAAMLSNPDCPEFTVKDLAGSAIGMAHELIQAEKEVAK